MARRQTEADLRAERAATGRRPPQVDQLHAERRQAEQATQDARAEVIRHAASAATIRAERAEAHAERLQAQLDQLRADRDR